MEKDTKTSTSRNLQAQLLDAHLEAPEIRYRRPYNMRHAYATAMLMAKMNRSWCAKQMGPSIEMFQRPLCGFQAYWWEIVIHGNPP